MLMKEGKMPHIIFIGLLALCSGCTMKGVTPAEMPPYVIESGGHAFEVKEVTSSAFRIESYPFRYDDVKKAIIELLTQRGVIVGGQERKGYVLVLGYPMPGIPQDSLVAVAVNNVSRGRTDVAFAWVEPGSEKCTGLAREPAFLLETEKSQLTAFERSQLVAVQFGEEISQQLGTHLYGPAKWKEKFFK